MKRMRLNQLLLVMVCAMLFFSCTEYEEPIGRAEEIGIELSEIVYYEDIVEVKLYDNDGNIYGLGVGISDFEIKGGFLRVRNDWYNLDFLKKYRFSSGTLHITLNF